jgi:hypothetical protein
MRRFFPNIYVVLILVTFAAVIGFGFKFTINSTAGSAQLQPRQQPITEAMNIASLNALLKNHGVRVVDPALLHAQTEQSQTILVRFQSVDNNSTDGFSAQMSENIQVSLLSVKTETGALSRQRVLELSPFQVLVVAVNAQKQVLWWDLQPDPRQFRAETSDQAGRLSGKTLYRNESEMLVSLPADAAIAEVLFYHPVWDGVSTYSLDQIGGLKFK